MSTRQDYYLLEVALMVQQDILEGAPFWYPVAGHLDSHEAASVYWSEVDLLGYEVTGKEHNG